jgi:hypothetical protein
MARIVQQHTQGMGQAAEVYVALCKGRCSKQGRRCWL